MIKTKSLSIIQASNRGCSPWEHRLILLGRQVDQLWIRTFSSYPHSFPRSHPHLCSWAPAAVSPHTHLTSPPVHHTVLKTSLLPFILAPNSSKWSLGTHRPLMPVKRIGQLQIFISCSYPLNRIAQPHPWFFIRSLLPLSQSPGNKKLLLEDLFSSSCDYLVWTPQPMPIHKSQLPVHRKHFTWNL